MDSVRIDLGRVQLDGNKIFRAAASSGECTRLMESIATAKAAEISSEINAKSHARGRHAFTKPVVVTMKKVRLSNPFTEAVIHTTSRGAYGIAAKHNLMHW